MDPVGHRRDQIAQELSCNHFASLFVQFDIGELRCTVDGHEQADFSLASADFSNVDMEIPDGVALESLLRLVALDLRQSANPVSLQTAVQRRARQMRYARLQCVEAVIQWQQCVASEGNNHGFLFDAENR